MGETKTPKNHVELANRGDAMGLESDGNQGVFLKNGSDL
jgi:hypothetical protein